MGTEHLKPSRFDHPVRQYDKYIYVAYIYIYIPGTCLSSILGLQPSKTRSFPSKTEVIWVPGIHKYIDMYVTLFCLYTVFGTKVPLYRTRVPVTSVSGSLVRISNCTYSTQLDDQDAVFQVAPELKTETILV